MRDTAARHRTWPVHSSHVRPRQRRATIDTRASGTLTPSTRPARVPELTELQTGPAFRFADWPNGQVPRRAVGVYTIWRADHLLYRHERPGRPG